MGFTNDSRRVVQGWNPRSKTTLNLTSLSLQEYGHEIKCYCKSNLIFLYSDESHLSRHLLHFVGLSILGIFVLEVSVCGVLIGIPILDRFNVKLLVSISPWFADRFFTGFPQILCNGMRVLLKRENGGKCHNYPTITSITIPPPPEKIPNIFGLAA